MVSIDDTYLGFRPQRESHLKDGGEAFIARKEDDMVVANFGFQTHDWAEAEAKTRGLDFVEFEE